MDYLLDLLARNYPLIGFSIFGYCMFRLGAIATTLRLRKDIPAWRLTELRLMGFAMLLIAFSCVALLFSTNTSLGYYLPLGMSFTGFVLMVIAYFKRRQMKQA